MTTFTVTATNLEHSSTSTGSHLMVVAAELPNLDLLLADLPDELMVVKIDRHQDAIEVITAALAEQPAQSLSIVAHGMAGQVLIGQRGIDRTSLIEQAANIRAWGVKTINLFSCRTGADAGFIEALSVLSGADVYASADAVGHAGLGASWTLRNHAGWEGAIPFSPEAQQRWQGRLAAFAVVAANRFGLPPLPPGFDSYAVTIPNSVTSIGTQAFLRVPVTSVTIPNSVTSIGAEAFRETQLTTVTIPNSVTSIGNLAFYLTPLTTVTIPNSVTSIGNFAFYLAPLTTVTIGSSVTSIGSGAFQQTRLTSVTIPNSVTSIGSSAFFGTPLTSVTIGSSVTSIGSGAFDRTRLTSVTIPNSVTSIGDAAFFGTPLTSVTIGNSVTSIGRDAFRETQLTTVTIPNSVTSIGSGAFFLTPLTSVTIGNSVTSIGNSAFEDTQLRSVTIPNSVTSIGDAVFLRAPLTSVTIGNSVTSIGRAAFANTQLTSVTIPASVTSIGNSAFLGTPLTLVRLPETAISIEVDAFPPDAILSRDDASIGGINRGAVNEDRSVVNGLLTVSGKLSITDDDAGQASFRSTVTSAPGNLGSLTIDASGDWTYSVSNSLSAVQALGAGQTKIETFTVSSFDTSDTEEIIITINGAVDNAPPTAVNFSNILPAIAEDTGTANRIRVAEITITDDGLGTNNLSIVGADAASFEIEGNTVYLKAGTALNYETKPSYSVMVAVDDPTVGGNPDATGTFTLNVANINEAPTAVNFVNITSAIVENTSTANRIKVADITITDDGLGTNNLSLIGADAASFEIVGTTLYLKAGTPLDFETKPSYSVTVAVNDRTVGSNPDATRAFTLNVTSANKAPTAVNFVNTTSAIAENTSTANRIKVADITITDDGLGTNNLSLAGTDAASFEIVGTALYLKAGTPLDFETKPSYNVTVAVDDPTVGTTPDATRAFTLTIINSFLVTNTNDSGVGSLRWAIENANTTSGIQTIEFAPGLSGQTVELRSAALQITDSVNIDGDTDNNGTADISVNARGATQLVSISANQTVTIEGMVLSAGQGQGFGGISNSGNLTLLNSAVVDNVDFGNVGLGGGGIYNSGTNSVLTLVGSTVSNNSTNKRGGGIYNNGGQVTITNSRIEGSLADQGGGGLYNNGGTVIVNNSAINNNSSTIGGGLMNENGTVTLNNSTLLNNGATDTVSGAINNQGSVLGAVVTLNGSTVSGGVYVNTVNSGSLVIEGTNSGETLQGSSGVDRISGSGGDDLLQGFQGSDILVGGDGNDIVNGGDNNDLLQGGAGNDRLGGLGGTDRMEGGTGDDVYTVNNAAATLVEGVGEGTDTVRSEISWSLGSNFEHLTLLGTGNLDGTGNDLINTLTGNSGENSLEGQSGNDRLIGNGGDDVLIGGAGADTVTGGGGNDRFVFNAIAEGGDRITDFTANSDRIAVSAAGFGAGLSVGALLSSQFAIGSLTTTDQRFLYDTSSGALFFDSNGSAAGNRTRIATLTAQPSISANDIVIVA